MFRPLPVAAPARILVVLLLASGTTGWAGDLLRGGSPLNSARRTAGGGSSAGADAAALAKANARDRLARTTQALDAMKAMQQAARDAAGATRRRSAGPLVRDGLGPRGLQVADGVPKNLKKPVAGENPALWIGANLPVETRHKGDVQVTITQNEQQALLNWKKFDIGSKTTLVFDQSKGGSDATKWVAFNKINDPSGRPSQILGSIKADGQVYVINQNGIIFGSTSQVNVHNLTASALPINDKIVAQGLLDNPGAEFLFDDQQTENLLTAISAKKPSVTFAQTPDPGTTPTITVTVRNSAVVNTFNLVEGVDYTLAVSKDRRTTLTLTEAGIAKAFPTGNNVTTEQFSASFGALTGDVVVERGARLFSPTSAASVGGRIALVGANVENRGTIETPDGQTILAAGLQVGFVAHQSDDPSLRGLDTFIGHIADPASKGPIHAGRAVNAGLIDVPRGDVEIAAAQIFQRGIIESSTSVSLNGRIDLLANYDAVGNPLYDATKTGDKLFVPRSTGNITLGKGSSMRILPELDDPAKVIGTKLALSSRVEIQGANIHAAAGSTLLAPSAEVNFSAGRWQYTAPANANASPASQFIYTAGQIYVDTGALIDVAGTPDAIAGLDQNIMTLQFRGAELSDTPLQRTSPLRGIDLTIDVRKSGTYGGRAWVGTPLADATGFVGLIERTVGELTGAGGSVTMTAGDSVVLRRDSTIDVSGGYLNYEGGFVETSRLRQGAQLIDIAAATPDQVYDGIYSVTSTETHSKWGITRTFHQPLALTSRHYEDAYISGAAGGSVSIQAATMAIDGQLRGNTVAGPRQLRDSSGKTALPVASSLSLKFRSQQVTDLDGTPTVLSAAPVSPRILIDPRISQTAPADFALDALDNAVPLDPVRRGTVVLSSDLVNYDGFGSLAIEDVTGKIVLGRGVELETQPGGGITFEAANIDIRGDITAPGGDLSFTAYNLSPVEFERLKALQGTPDAPLRMPVATSGKGGFILRDGASLSTAGLLVDNRFFGENPALQPIEQTGGSISVAAYDVRLASGSVVDVSGGVLLNAQGKPSYGDAGSIALLAGRDPQVGAEAVMGGELKLGGELRGFSGAAGGSLSLQAMRVRIGGGGRKSDGPTFDLAPDFFNEGGFRSFSIAGIASAPLRRDPLFSGNELPAEEAFRSIPDNRFRPGLTIAPDLVIAPEVQSWLARPIGGVTGSVTIETTVQPEGLRAPMTLNFEARGAKDLFSGLLVARADLEFGEGASIQAGARGSVSLKGDTVDVEGLIDAPGGTINITGAASLPLLGRLPQSAQTTVYIGAGSRLNAAGRVLLVPNNFQYRTGSVLSGGAITIAGNIVAEPGSVLDVSGATGTLDVAPERAGFDAPSVAVTSGVTDPLFSRVVVPVQVDSDGGSIVLKGSQLLVAESTLRGAAGGPTAQGGSLAVSSGRFYLPDEVPTPVDVNLVVRQSGTLLKDFVQTLRTDLSAGTDAATKGSLTEFVPSERGVRKVVVGADGKPLPARGYFAVDQFTTGGFDSLDLEGVVKFSGPVTIDARGKIAVAAGVVNIDGTVTGGGVLMADDAVTLRAPYVALGTTFAAPLQPTAQAFTNLFGGGSPYFFGLRYGPGSLTVEAKLIDVGNLAVRGVKVTRLYADDGDIRGQGVLAVPGRLRLRAGQIYPVTGGQFTLEAYDYRSPVSPDDSEVDPTHRKIHPGSIVVTGSGSRQLPLSAGGTLNLYASDIVQNGVLRAPIGTINLGWDGTGPAQKSTIVGGLDTSGTFAASSLPVSKRVVLGPTSMTSVSAVDPNTGRESIIPYGLVTNADSWVDPRGVDITTGGVPEKSIRISAGRLNAQSGSVVDISGGGNLQAYRWIQGQGGTQDILASETSFAVIPGYQADFAPFAPFNQSTVAQAAFNPARVEGDPNVPGYVNSKLQVGDRVHLGASAGLPEGDYTLLPARYALQPGAVLVTPKSGDPVGTLAMPDGSSLVSGYTFNGLDATSRPEITGRFEVAPADVFRARAEYENFYANAYLRHAARQVGVDVPRLPRDAGRLVFQAQQGMRLNGAVNSMTDNNGIGAMIDIATPQDILITDHHLKPGQRPKDTVVLNSATLSDFGAESLLIGGVREAGEQGTTVAVQTGSIVVDNSEAPLSGSEIILVARDGLTLDPFARVEQTGVMADGAEKLFVQGDGLLLRVSSDASASIARTDRTTSTVPKMTIGRGAVLSGTSLILDSSSATDLSPAARLLGDYVSLDSGQITLRLGAGGEPAVTDGLVLGGTALRDLQGVQSLSLLSYSSLDVYGHGQLTIDGNLELHAGQIRGFDQGNGEMAFSAGSIVLDNEGRGTRLASSTDVSGRLSFQADTIELGRGRLAIDQYANVTLDADQGVRFAKKGQLLVQNDLTVRSPALTGENSASNIVRAGGQLQLLAGKSTVASAFAPGLGASLTLEGASVMADSEILFPSGLVTIRATTGDVNVSGRVDVGGTVQETFDRITYTSAGKITLAADEGSVHVAKTATLSVAAAAQGNAGTLAVETPTGALDLEGSLLGQGGKGGMAGSFLLDIKLANGLTALNQTLDAAGFFEQRGIRVREGDIVLTGTTTARRFDLAADHGNITVLGKLDASGETGGDIRLQASGDLVLDAGSELTVAAKNFDAAGKGGSILLEAGSETNGVAGAGILRINAGARLNLGVVANTPESAAAGKFEGILHLRAPRNAANNDLQIAPIDGTINGASHVIVEGYKIYDLNPGLTANSPGIITDGTLPNTPPTGVRKQIKDDAIAFLGAAGVASVTYDAMLVRLLASNPALDSILSIRPGVELINRSGDLTLGSQTSGANNDWNLAAWRFGPKSAPGVLTLRAAGDLVFFNALQDGFAITNAALAYRAPLLAPNPLLSANAQSWSFRLTAGADLDAVDYASVQPLGSLDATMGSLRLGKFVASGGTANTSGSNATTLSAVTGSNSSLGGMAPSTQTRYQVIRTGSGDIDVHAGRDVQLLNQFATIYTAGTLIADPTMNGQFDLPNLTGATGGALFLGALQQNPPYAVQYTVGGGNVSITAGNDIAHYLRTAVGVLTDDSSRELPMNWLYRRGYVDPVTGQFGASTKGDIASTTWWIDFANFFEGVAALGGGNVSLIAGRDVRNVDGLVPTNARMPKGVPDATKMVELGGGDLTVRAGRDINGGVYYIERGNGVLTAGNSILTNATRSPSLTILGTNEEPLVEQTWLPTTLFLGKGSYDVSAQGDVTLGPVANPFLLPEGYNNIYRYKTYFSTYAPSNKVNITSLGGSVNLRLEASTTGATLPMIAQWLQNVLLFSPSAATPNASTLQPWLRLNENDVSSFTGVSGLMPASLRVAAPAGDVNIIGDLTLAPAPRGTLDISAGGSVNGLQPDGLDSEQLVTWYSSHINVSDASPTAVPQVTSPFAYQSLVPNENAMRRSGIDFLQFVDQLFEETGAINTVLETKQTLHSAGLHADDPEPLRVYAGEGNISGFTLFSPKPARILAGTDITDVAFYVQNLTSEDVTTVAAGRDVAPYKANSLLRSAALSVGNALSGDQNPQPGDIQLGGPGSLEVLAGRTVDLGTGASNNDGTATGLTTIGNRRNPFLPFDGGNVVVGAGLGPVTSLMDSHLDFPKFVDEIVSTPQGASELAEALGLFKTADSVSEQVVVDTIAALPPEQQAGVLLDTFFLALRDAGRQHNIDGSPGFGNYDSGFAAIAALFGQEKWRGDVLARGRDIRTRNGGNIDIFAPGGELRLASNVIGNPEVPPGIITETGGNIDIFTDGDVNIGVGRIFTLRGGNMVIWSSTGDIAAGSASKTVSSAPPTRVFIDPQSANVETDLAGLSTGGGIGVLATVAGVAPGDVDLIAPTGVIDAGDAGIRVSGNLNLAATAVLNASNISVSGSTAGAPVAAPVSAPNIAGLTSAANTAGAANSAANDVANQARQQAAPDETPSVFTVEVLGYGGDDDSASTAPAGGGA